MIRGCCRAKPPRLNAFIDYFEHGGRRCGADVWQAIAEMIASSEQTDCYCSHWGRDIDIGVPIAVASTYSLIADSAIMTIHPIRMNGLIIEVPQTF